MDNVAKQIMKEFEEYVCGDPKLTYFFTEFLCKLREITNKHINDNESDWVEDERYYGYATLGGNPVYKCKSCDWVYGSVDIFPKYKFCPNCGKRMKGVE